MKKLSNFVNSILAGVCIAIGGTVFLSLENRVLGALLFSVGLFTVCTFGFNLFTGKVAYIFDNKPSYTLWTVSVWAGNLIGAVLVGTLLRMTRLGIVETAATISQVKLGDSLLSIFILAVFCNVLIVIATESYKNNPHPIGKYLGIVFGIMVFILCGFEHCVANMFYFTVAGAWSANTILYLLIMTLGNTVGAVLIPLCRKLQSAHKDAETGTANESAVTNVEAVSR